MKLKSGVLSNTSTHSGTITSCHRSRTQIAYKYLRLKNPGYEYLALPLMITIVPAMFSNQVQKSMPGGFAYKDSSKHLSNPQARQISQAVGYLAFY